MLTKRRHTSPFVMFFVKSIHRTSPHRYTITTTTTIKITQPSEKELHTTHLRCPALNGKNCDLISASPYSIKSVSSCIITIQPLKRLPMSLDCFHSILNISVSLCILCCTDVVTFLLLSFYTYTIQRLSFFFISIPYQANVWHELCDLLWEKKSVNYFCCVAIN